MLLKEMKREEVEETRKVKKTVANLINILRS